MESLKSYDCMLLISEREYAELREMKESTHTRNQTMGDKNNVSNLEINNEGIVLMNPNNYEGEKSAHKESESSFPPPPSTENLDLTNESKPHTNKVEREGKYRKSKDESNESIKNSSRLIRVVEKGIKDRVQPVASSLLSDKLADNTKSEDAINELGRKKLKPKKKLTPSRKRKRGEEAVNLEDYPVSPKQSKKEGIDLRKFEPMDTSLPVRSLFDEAGEKAKSEILKKVKFKNSKLNTANIEEPMDIEKRALKRSRVSDTTGSVKRGKWKETAAEYIQNRYSQLQGKKKKKSEQSSLKSTKAKKRRRGAEEEEDEVEDEYFANKKSRDRLSYINVEGKRKRDDRDEGDLEYFATRYQPHTFKENLKASRSDGSTKRQTEVENKLYDSDGDYIMI